MTDAIGDPVPRPDATNRCDCEACGSSCSCDTCECLNCTCSRCRHAG